MASGCATADIRVGNRLVWGATAGILGRLGAYLGEAGISD